MRGLACAAIGCARVTIVDASIIDAPSSTKNRRRARGPEMRYQTQEGQAADHFGMKAHIGGGRRVGSGAQVTTHGGQRKRRDAGGSAALAWQSTARGRRCYQGVEKRLRAPDAVPSGFGDEAAAQYTAGFSERRKRRSKRKVVGASARLSMRFRTREATHSARVSVQPPGRGKEQAAHPRWQSVLESADSGRYATG